MFLRKALAGLLASLAAFVVLAPAAIAQAPTYTTPSGQTIPATPSGIRLGGASPCWLGESGCTLPTSGGGGGGGAVYGPTAVGSNAANPPILTGGTTNGTATGPVSVQKCAAGLCSVSIDAVTVTVPVSNAGTFAVQNTAATPAGTNVIGKVGIDQTTPGTTNGVIQAPNTAAAAGVTPTLSTSNGYTLKSSAGNLYGINATNRSTAVAYICLLNTATTPSAAAGITPVKTFALAAGQTLDISYDIPKRFSVGITIVITTDPTTFTAPGTGLTAIMGGDVL